MRTPTKASNIFIILMCGLAILVINMNVFMPSKPKPADMRKEQISLVTDTGAQAFTVEIAETPLQREVGLMNRESLAENEGMLFHFKETLPVQMWMKDTHIPLDMLFIDAAGNIVTVHENALINSQEIISSEGPVYAVLEVNAGVAAKLGIHPGNRVEHAIFQAASAQPATTEAGSAEGSTGQAAPAMETAPNAPQTTEAPTAPVAPAEPTAPQAPTAPSVPAQ